MPSACNSAGFFDGLTENTKTMTVDKFDDGQIYSVTTQVIGD